MRAGASHQFGQLTLLRVLPRPLLVLAHDAVRQLNASGLTARRAADGVLEWRVAGIPVVQPGAA